MNYDPKITHSPTGVKHSKCMEKGPIFFVCSGRDYHAIDWYRSVKKISKTRECMVVSDLIEGEAFERLLDETDIFINVFPLDKFLPSKQSNRGNLIRNFAKLLIAPLFIKKLRELYKSHGDTAVFHAHSMYYIFICWLSRIPFLATPMGSDVLIRPKKSFFYRQFTKWSLAGAQYITVDSEALVEAVSNLCGRSSYLIQNGINTEQALSFQTDAKKGNTIISPRGLEENYQILELIEARNDGCEDAPLILFYPFSEKTYLKQARDLLNARDKDLGKVSKKDMLAAFSGAKAVISIPKSDSSPRTVYEAIFAGAPLLVSYGRWLDSLPNCMLSRIVVVDLNKKNWLEDGLKKANEIANRRYLPSEEAIEKFDEEISMGHVCKLFYDLVA